MKNCLIRIAALTVAVVLSVSAQGCRENSEKQPETQNIILMVGDGMGIAHITALMIDNGYANPINLDRARTAGLIKTYSLNNRVTDSGASATAYATGHKTKNSRLSVDVEGNRLETIVEKGIAQRGMSGGVVAAIAVQHATPGAFYGHAIHRGNYNDVALGMLDTELDVAIGGGRAYMENRPDSVDIVAELTSRGYIIAENLEGLDGVTSGKAMAIYPGKAYDFPTIKGGRDPQYLPRATAKALEILTSNSAGRGFFLMVEGSMIDGVSHEKDGDAVVAEMRDFDNAVGVAFDYADTHPGTLVIVLADHETGGLAIPPGDTDFLKGESGIYLRFATSGHTGTMVPVFAYGTGAERFTGILENDEVGRLMQQALGLK